MPDPVPQRRAGSSRRAFLKSAAAGALVVGTWIVVPRRPATAKALLAETPAEPNAFVRIGADDTVTVIVKHLDMGQGNTTGLATIVADELDADWAQVRTEFAPADAERYRNLLFGTVQGTGGSTAIANSWHQLRKAGAAAREMLVAAAAAEWGVPPGEVTVERGVIRHEASGRDARFGAFAAAASRLAVPAEPRLKDPAQWVHIGRNLPRLDARPKSTGQAVYAMDVRLPGMLTAVVARPPRFGARLASFDAAAARRVSGVVDVVRVPSGVAVLARGTWAALKGRDALRLAWDEAGAERRSSAELMAEYRRTARRRGLTALDRGDARLALERAARVLEAEFEFPYLAHAAMEPLNAVIAPSPDGGVEVWAGSQMPTMEQAVVAGTLGMPPKRVRLNTVWAGGSFGRRATPSADYLAEAAAVFKASGGTAPVHLVWTREDDMAGGFYRPMAYHRVRAGLDGAGRIAGWEHAVVTKSVLIGSPFEAMLIASGVDASTVEGIATTDYAIPDMRVEVHNAKEATPVLWWRSFSHSHTAHAMEVFVDELAAAAGRDPVAFRLDLLRGAPRPAAVLRLAAEKACWGEGRAPGQGRGVAAHSFFGTSVAMVADVTVAGGSLGVDRIVAAVDCGIAINPDVIAAQIEGAVGFALSSVLRNRVTLRDGLVQERNFDAYEPTRMAEMPRVEVHVVPSSAEPTGVGESGVPPLAPAIANAVFDATGHRLRSLPLDLAALRHV